MITLTRDCLRSRCFLVCSRIAEINPVNAFLLIENRGFVQSTLSNYHSSDDDVKMIWSVIHSNRALSLYCFFFLRLDDEVFLLKRKKYLKYSFEQLENTHLLKEKSFCRCSSFPIGYMLYRIKFHSAPGDLSMSLLNWMERFDAKVDCDGLCYENG